MKEGLGLHHTQSPEFNPKYHQNKQTNNKARNEARILNYVSKEEEIK